MGQARRCSAEADRADTAPGEARTCDKAGLLAEGEVTGHAHVLDAADVELLITETERYLRVITETPLKHEEHDAVVLPPGDYEIIIQREYSPKQAWFWINRIEESEGLPVVQT